MIIVWEGYQLFFIKEILVYDKYLKYRYSKLLPFIKEKEVYYSELISVEQRPLNQVWFHFKSEDKNKKRIKVISYFLIKRTVICDVCITANEQIHKLVVRSAYGCGLLS